MGELSTTFDKAFNADYMGKFGAKVDEAAAKINALRNATTASVTESARLDSSNKDYHTAATDLTTEAAKLKSIEVLAEQHNLAIKALNDNLTTHSKAALAEIADAERGYASALAGKDQAKITAASENLRLSKKIYADYQKDTQRMIDGENAAFAEASKVKKVALSDEEKAAQKTAKEFKKDYDAAIKSSADFTKQIQDETVQVGMTTTQKADYAAEQVAARMAEAGVRSSTIAAWLNDTHQATVALEALKEAEKVDGSVKTEMDALIDKYNQLTLSARDYYALTLLNKGISPEKSKPMLAQFDKNTLAEANKKTVDDAHASLVSYNNSLDQANAKTSDLGAVTSAIFDGALGGINTMAGAFDNMVNAIGKNTAALDEFNRAKKLNETEADPAFKAANI
jgi:hypothetical protein